MRSPTTERILSDVPGIEVISAGAAKDAELRVGGDLVQWADIILVMKKVHARKLKDRFKEHLANIPIKVLGIPDNYSYMQKELVELLEKRLPKHLAIPEK